MFKRVQLFIFFTFILLNVVRSQHNVSFQVPSQVCIGEVLNIQNNSDVGTATWNFCSALNNTYSSSLDGIISPSMVGMSVLENNGVWIGFAVTRDNNLIRINFGDNPNNSNYTLTPLGNPGGLLNAPDWIHIIKSGAKWFGLVTNQSNEIIKLTWDDLMKAPTAQSLNLSGTGVLNLPAQVEIEFDGTNYVAIVANAGSNQLVLINFGNSMENMPGGADVIVSPVFPGTVNMYGVTAKRVCGQWVIFTSVTNKMYRVNIGSQLYNPISASQIVDFSSDFPSPIGSYVRMKSIVDGGDIFVYYTSYTTGILSAFTWTPGAVQAVYKDLSTVTVPDQLYSLETFTHNNTSGLYVGSFGSGAIYNVGMDYQCSANQSTSTAFTPNGIYFKTAGNYNITLSIQFPDGSVCGAKQQVMVTSSVAPDISIQTQNNCVNNPVNFSSQNSSANITSYHWDFGDGTGTSSNANPTYSFTNNSKYQISLNVNASNGCSNTAQTSLQIFNQPQANFTLPSTSPICTNQNYTLINSSVFDVGSDLTWQWSVNGTNVSTTKNLDLTITSTSTQNIALTASIPGCSTQFTNSISTIVDGPKVDFTSATAGCVGSSIKFINSTTSTATSYTWDFGDGNTSTQTTTTSVSNTYANTGPYAVKLTVSNAAGCQNFASKNISIYSNPQPAFAIEAPPFSCANYPAQFDNNTSPPTDSNIVSWSWAFGDAASGSSTQKNPSYTFTSEGSYNVSLTATTNFGCSATQQNAITIGASPTANFKTSPACVNQGTQFTDLSNGSITSYEWSVQGTVLSGASPSPYTFKAAGSYPVTLTVTANGGCKNQITKTVVVPVMPVIDFTVTAPCTRNPTIFQELNTGGSDPATAWNWSFNGVSSGAGSPFAYTFAVAGGYSVALTSTRQSGCVYSSSKNVIINNGPIAAFIPTPLAGAAPLTVTFQNNSLADSYIWSFGDADNTTSTTVSPIFTYTKLGKYKARLTANNSYGCTDTLSSEINVVIPKVDLAMQNFALVNDPTSGVSRAVVTIYNSGNIPLTNPDVKIDLAGNAMLKEAIQGTVIPGKSVTTTLSLEIIPRSLDYICAMVNAISDVDPSNDEKCLSYSNSDYLFSPYPNPATGTVNMDWISAAAEEVKVSLYKTTGELAFQQQFSNVAPGLVQLSISTATLSNGLYLIRFEGARDQKTFRIMVAN